jgi:hypothetical protein
MVKLFDDDDVYGNDGETESAFSTTQKSACCNRWK